MFCGNGKELAICHAPPLWVSSECKAESKQKLYALVEILNCLCQLGPPGLQGSSELSWRSFSIQFFKFCLHKRFVTLEKFKFFTLSFVNYPLGHLEMTYIVMIGVSVWWFPPFERSPPLNFSVLRFLKIPAAKSPPYIANSPPASANSPPGSLMSLHAPAPPYSFKCKKKKENELYIFIVNG